MIVSEYLNKPEALTLQDQLRQKDIDSSLKQHGPTRFLWGGIYYQVHVDKRDSVAARGIAEEFGAKLSRERKESEALLIVECPECQSRDIRVEEKRSLFQRLLYFRVTVRVCNQCSWKWYT